MTVGAYINWRGTPVLLADTVVTGADPKIQPNEVFAKSIAKALSGSGLKFFGLMRKLVDLSPQISFCWAGRVVEAAAFKKEFEKTISTKPFGKAEFSNFIRNYPKEDCKNLQIIAIYMSGKTHQVECINSVEFELNGASVSLIGSGTAELFKILSSYEDSFASKNFHPSSLAMIAMSLYHHVTITGFGVKEGWGGGFEARFGAEGVINRLGQMASAVYAPKFSGEGLGFREISSYANFYIDDWAFFMCNGSPMVAVPIDYDFSLPIDLQITFRPEHISIGFAFGNKGLFVTFIIDGDIPRIAGGLPQKGNTFSWVFSEEAMTRAYQLMSAEFPAWKKKVEAGNAVNVLANRIE